MRLYGWRLGVGAMAACVALIGSAACAANPTLANVPYGPDPQQVLDVYQAKSPTPAPFVFFIHGGGWMTGDKANPDFLAQALEKGISVVSINYRLIKDKPADGSPAVKACLDDCACALQFTRSKAAEWKLDKTRVAAVGGSAGGFNSLWLAFHDDMAKPESTDPVARESTRVTCALTFVPQTTLDPKQAIEWIPGNTYGHHAFLLPSYQEFLKQRDALMPYIHEYSPYYLATPDDPPVYLFYDSVPALGKDNFKDLVHSSNWGAGLVPQLQKAGIKYEFNYPGAKVAHPDLFSFIASQLQKSPAKSDKLP